MNEDILDLTAAQVLERNAVETSIEDRRKVGNLQPFLKNTPYRIAIVGEAPGKDEVEQGKPFVGYSGKDLDRYLSKFSILRDACFIGNVCQHRPPDNVIATFDWQGPQIQGGLSQLKIDLAACDPKPNLILLLGGSALHAFKNPNIIPKKRKDKQGLRFIFPDTISCWRGSFFEAHENSPLPGVKCVASYHPAACMRQYEFTPYLLFDIYRASIQGKFPELNHPVRQIKHTLSFYETLQELDKLLLGSDPFGTDIEGYWNYFRCISFSPSSDYAFIVPFIRMDGTSFWSVGEEAEILKRVSELLYSPRASKVWQNGLYDRFALQYGQNIICRGNNYDIMLRHWENHCEFDKALDVQCSIYTDQPYYKGDYKSQSPETFWSYCCLDSCVTKEIFHKVTRYLKPRSLAHAHFNEDMLWPLLYMELRGIKYSKETAKSRLSQVVKALAELQFKLDRIAGFGLPIQDKTILRALLRDHMCWKNDPTKVKKEFVDDGSYDLCMRILVGDGPLSPSDQGKVSSAIGRSLNVKGGDLKTYLYETLDLPVQYNKDSGAASTDYGALLTLRKKSKHPSIPLIIEMTELRTRKQMLEMETDPDGRIRSGLNVVGSKTGRVTSSKSPTGSGMNLQTLPDVNDLKPLDHYLHLGMRDLCVADEGCYLAKLDLKGADGWTIGANLAALGDSTMLDDLRFGLKPAHFPCMVRRHESILGKSRQELKEMFKVVKKSDWDYFAAKQCTWGFCYQMGLDKAAEHIFEVSEGTVTVTREDMQLFKDAIFLRYNVPLWHKAMERHLFNQPYPPKLLAPSGHEREFWGRKQEIVGTALAHEPQEVTTYVINMGVRNCWFDPENRTSENRIYGSNPSGRKRFLKIEPLHQVHDEAVFQFKKIDLTWALGKIKSWFNNPITVAGITLTIPFEGAYGTAWDMGEETKVGDII